MRTVFEARAATILFRLADALPEGVFLLPANICPVVPMALLLAGRSFEHLDLSATSLALDPARIRDRLVDRNRPPVAAVLYVRTYGAVANAKELFAEIRRRHAIVIDDRCLARPEPDVGAFDDQGAGAVLFSTGYSKPVDLGYGGFAHLEEGLPYASTVREFDPVELETATAIYNRAIERKEAISKADVAGLTQMRWLDTSSPDEDWTSYRRRVLAARERADDHRRRMNRVYRKRIPSHVQLGPDFDGWRFQVRLPERDRALKAIFAAGRFASAHYFPSSVLFPTDTDRFPVATRLASDILNLFNDFRFDESAANELGELVAQHLEALVDR